jgi:hypothetical protein
MKPARLLLLALTVFFALALLLPISEAQRARRGQGLKGPSRESPAPPSNKRKPKTTPKSRANTTNLRSLQEATPTGPISVQAENFAVSEPLSEIASGSAAVESDVEEGDQESAENRSVREVTDAAISNAKRTSSIESLRRDTVVQLEAPTMNIPNTSLTFEGLGRTENIAAGFGNVSPPDTNGDVGPNHYVQQTNLLVRVWNKAGVPLTAPFRLSALFAPLGGQCAAPDNGDPIVLYDPLSDRWMLSQFAFASQTAVPYHQCIAISKTPDPTGAYFLYDFITVGFEFPDYPHLGVWPDGYYMMVHQFTLGGPFNGTGAYAFNRLKMLTGDPTANYIYFNLNVASHPEGIGGSLPSDVDGLTPPPPGRPNTFVYFTTTDFGDPATGLRLFDFHADFNTPANSTFTERPESTLAAPLVVAPFSVITPSGRRDVPQPAPAATVTTALDAIEDRLMHRLQYRNRGGFETLVLTHTVGAPGSTVFGTYRAGVRYYELRRALPGGNFVVQEQATFAPADGVSRWLGSAAEDHQGNLAVGYSVSSGAAGGNVPPGIRYAGRLAGDPPNGLTQGEATLVAGTGVQASTGNRWGDYSALAVDPADDCTFWYTNEYYTAAGQAASSVGWQTRIGAFKFTQCTPAEMGTLSGTITYCDTGAPVVGALVKVSDGHTGVTGADGTYSLKLAPGSYTVQVSDGSSNCITSPSANINITNGGTTDHSACLSGSPQIKINGSTISGGNGDNVINPNECNSMIVDLANIGCGGTTNVSAVLSTNTPRVSVEQPNSPYPNIAHGAHSTNTVPFEFSTAPPFVCGTVINFTLTVTTDQGVSVINFSKPTCNTPPVPFSGSIAAGDTTMTGRIGRNGVVSSCAFPKNYPGTQDLLANRRYDAYSFTNSGNATTCVTVNLTSGCGVNIFGVVYLDSFNPANLQQNYLADNGSSFAGTGTFSFNVPAFRTFVLVVHEVNVGAGCASYSGTVSGLLSGAFGAGSCQTCAINPQSDITVNNDPDQCGAVVNYSAATSTGSCGVLTSSPASGSFFPLGETTVTTTSTSGASSTFKVTVNDTQKPAVGNPSATPASLWPPNHLMQDVTINYTATDNCPGLNCVLAVTSNEPLNGTGDGDTSPDWEIIDNHHVRLRAERAGTGKGRIYTVTTTCTDAAGNVTTKSTQVVVPQSMGSSKSNTAVRINTPVNLGGVLSDVGGMTSPTQFIVESARSAGSIAQPSGSTGNYIFTTPGVYKVRTRETDNSTSPVADSEATVVVFDPSGGSTTGQGWVIVPGDSYTGDLGLTGKLGFSFSSKYTNAKNPTGNTQVKFKRGNFEFNALNYNYLTISGNRAQVQGVGKVNGETGYNFILTVVDGNTKGGVVDKFRIKVWNKSTGAIVFDNQCGASDAEDPTAAVGSGSTIVIRKKSK